MNDAFGIRINVSTREFKENYESALTAVEELKGKMDELERLVINKTSGELAAIDAAIDKFNGLIDLRF